MCLRRRYGDEIEYMCTVRGNDQLFSDEVRLKVQTQGEGGEAKNPRHKPNAEVPENLSTVR